MAVRKGKSPEWGEIMKKGAFAGLGAASVGIIQKQIPEEYQKYSSYVPVVGGAILMKQPNDMLQLIGLGMFASGISDIAKEKMPKLFGEEPAVNGGAIQAPSPGMLTEKDMDDMEMAVAMATDGLNGADDADEYDEYEEVNGNGYTEEEEEEDDY